MDDAKTEKHDILLVAGNDGLDSTSGLLQKLAKQVSAAVKARAQGKDEYGKCVNEAAKLARQVNWNALVTTLEAEARGMRETEEAHLRSRREKLLQAASAARCPNEMGARFDRIDIFQVEYEGVTAVVKLGGVVAACIKEADGEKLFGQIKQLRAGLEQTPFNRESFLKLLKNAYTTCRRTLAGDDEYVPVHELHREMVLERARNSDRFRKSAEAKAIEPYALTQFVFDLARFLREGAVLGAERIVAHPPSMRQTKETVQIPNLENPRSPETSAARLAVTAA